MVHFKPNQAPAAQTWRVCFHTTWYILNPCPCEKTRIWRMRFHTTWYILNYNKYITENVKKYMFPHHMVHFKRHRISEQIIMNDELFPHHMVHFKRIFEKFWYFAWEWFPHHMVHFKRKEGNRILIPHVVTRFPHHMVHFKLKEPEECSVCGKKVSTPHGTF